MHQLNESIPKNGSTLRVVSVGRISTEHQDVKSLADQDAKIRNYIQENYPGPVEYTSIASRGSGEYLDRAELRQLEDYIDSGEYDLVIAEDLGRICRRQYAFTICEACEDSNTRLIALNDRLDTFDEGWRDTAMFATWHHEKSNKETSERIRRTLRHRFSHGEALPNLIAGYVKPRGAKHDSQISKDPLFEEIYDQWFTRLEDGDTFAGIADWLNQLGIPTGPHCKTKKWTGTLVGKYTRNPLLKGTREHNRMISKRRNKTGRRRNEPASSGLLQSRHVPHLAFIDPERYDRVVETVNTRNAIFSGNGKRKRGGGSQALFKSTRWPGQHLLCGICGRSYVYGGHGRRDHLMCDGARAHNCWNGATVDGPLMARRVVEAIRQEIEAVAGFDEAFLEMVRLEMEGCHSGSRTRQAELESKLSKLEGEMRNLLEAIQSTGHSPALLGALSDLEQRKASHQQELARLDRQQRAVPVIPSADELRQLAREAFAELPLESTEFWLMMKNLVSKVEVYPYRHFFRGNPVLRAKVQFNLLNLIPNQREFLGSLPEVSRTLVIDTFKKPQHEEHRAAVVEMRKNSERTFAEIAASLGITDTAAQRAAEIQRKMDEQGLSEPYFPLREPVTGSDHIRRHEHPRYQFAPLPGYENPAFPTDLSA